MGSTAQASAAGRSRIAGRVAVLVAVLTMHACVMRSVRDSVIDFDTGQRPTRIELVPVQDMAFSTPPAPAASLLPPPVAPPPPPRPPRQATPVVAAASAAASAPAEAASAPEAEPVVAAASVPDVPPSAPVAAASAASEPAVVAAAVPASAPASAADSFSWPPSTVISYELTGNYRGEVYGSAQVDWVRVGDRYQVHLDVTVGAGFAPLYTRRMSSDGLLSDAGLVPERYDEDSKAAFKDRKRASVTFEPDAVVLNKGQRVDRLPGVQDTASQFVQLTYLFIRRPDLLTPGGTIELPLALPKRMSQWTYDVRAPETIYTPFGAVDAVPLQPRRESRKGDEFSATVWFAPTLRYMPIRIRIQQDTDTYLDLMIKQRPQIAK